MNTIVELFQLSMIGQLLFGTCQGQRRHHKERKGAEDTLKVGQDSSLSAFELARIPYSTTTQILLQGELNHDM